MVGDRVEHGRRTAGQMIGVAFEALAHVRELGVVAVPHAHDEVGAGEQHDLAGLDDVLGGRHRLVLDVTDGAQHQEQHVVVALELRALVGVDGVLDHQLVESEGVRDVRHLLLVGVVQPEPHESRTAPTYLCHRLGVAVAAGQAVPVDVDRAVDHRLLGGDRGSGAATGGTRRLVRHVVLPHGMPLGRGPVAGPRRGGRPSTGTGRGSSNHASPPT